MNYVRNLWYVAGWSHDLNSNTPLGVRILGEPIVLWRDAAGKVSALEDRCVHRLAPLSLGRCEGEKLRCMYHGLLYDKSGVVVEIPGQDKIPAQARVRSYPVVEKHSWLWVWMGDPRGCNENEIPPAVGLDDPNFILGTGQIEYAAEARLINDNLLDFSHLSFVHLNSFGATDQWARERPKITPLKNGVRIERWIQSPPGKSLMGNRTEPVDRYQRYDFLLPGILLMTGGGYPSGTGQKSHGESPDLDDATDGVSFTSQAVTPVTDKTSRYFFSWGPHRKFGDEALRDTLMKIADKAFGEDRLIIEAQQKVIDATAAPKIMPTGADRAITLFNQMVAKRIREETLAQGEVQTQARV